MIVQMNSIRDNAGSGLNIMRQIQLQFSQVKDENSRLCGEVLALKQSQEQLIARNAQLLEQVNSILADKLNHLSLNVDYENLIADHKAAVVSLNSLQAEMSTMQLEQKRKVFMFERENEELCMSNEKLKQQVNQMTVQFEEMFAKMAETGYGELVSYNQRLLERIASRDLELQEVNAASEKAKTTHSEELSRQMFNYEILVSQYQTLLRENANLIKATSASIASGTTHTSTAAGNIHKSPFFHTGNIPTTQIAAAPKCYDHQISFKPSPASTSTQKKKLTPNKRF